MWVSREMDEKKNVKICFAASSGGHYEQLMMLKPLMEKYDSFIITEKTDYSAEQKGEKTYYMKQVNRREKEFIWRMIQNAWKSIGIYRKEKPDVVICTGVLAMIPICLISKLTDKNISNPGIISYSLWCKVVRREIYVKAQELVDDKIVIGEDMLCSLYCLKLAKSMVCLDESFYVYRILNNSMMHSYNVKKFEHFENTVKALVESEIVDDRRIYAYSFHALCNEYAGIAESVNSISEFRNKILETHKFKLLYDMASRVDKSNCDLASRFKIWLVNNKKYDLMFLLLKLKNR